MKIDKNVRELYPDETIDYDEMADDYSNETEINTIEENIDLDKMADDVFNQVNSDEYQEPIFDQSKDFEFDPNDGNRININDYGFDENKTVVHGTSLKNARKIAEDEEFTGGTLAYPARGGLLDASTWAKNIYDENAVVIIAETDQENVRKDDQYGWISVGDRGKERKYDDTTYDTLKINKMITAKPNNDYALKEFDINKNRNLMDVSSYNKNEYIGDSRIDTAYMDTFNITDEKTGFMGHHNYQRANTQLKKQQQKEYYQRPEVKAHQKEYYQRPEIKAKQKEYHKEYNQRPEATQRKQEYNQRPEVVAKRSQKYYDSPEIIGRIQNRLSIKAKQRDTKKLKQSGLTIKEIEDFFGVGIL